MPRIRCSFGRLRTAIAISTALSPDKIRLMNTMFSNARKNGTSQ